MVRRAVWAESGGVREQARPALEPSTPHARTPHIDDLPLERLAKLPFTEGNNARLLIDGQAAFASILAGITAARDYVQVQFDILRDDSVGLELSARLLERAAVGVRVYLLYDETGCYALPRGMAPDACDGGTPSGALPGQRAGRRVRDLHAVLRRRDQPGALAALDRECLFRTR